MDIKFISLKSGIKQPQYSTEYSAGSDLIACINTSITIESNSTEVIPTGIAIEIPREYFGMVCSRSGLAAKFGISVLNSPGIIDSDYRGEIKCILHNSSSVPFVVEPGIKIAQIIIIKYEQIKWIQVKELSETSRGTGGLGSTGLK